MNDPTGTTQTYRKELLKNQLWQVLNFASKAGFLILLTPLMISRWGEDGYGLFALASSLLVSMAILDGGVRALTRIQMAEAWKNGDEEAAKRIYQEGLMTFILVCLFAIAISGILAATGWMTALLKLPKGGDWILVMTVVCTAILMISILGLEPLAAKGNLSALKAANTWGALLAIPLCGTMVLCGAGIGAVVLAYTASLTMPNLVVAWKTDLLALAPWECVSRFAPRIVWETLHAGAWYYLTTVSLIAKTHALTFLVSGMAGPAQAGLFYVLLRLSEIIGNVGATASETSLAALTTASSLAERRENFRQSWLHVALFCIQGALVFIFLIQQLLSLWLHSEEGIPRLIGITLAIFGLAGAFSRVVVNSSMGLNLIRAAAIAGLWEAAGSIAGASAGFHFWGLSGLFLGGSIGVIALIPMTSRISEECGFKSLGEWFLLLQPLLPGLGIAAAALFCASLIQSPWAWFPALGVSGMVALWQLRGIHTRH